jgi:hypothetical protein
MDLIHEEHVARLQIGEDRRQIARALEYRAGRLSQADAEFGRENIGGPKINT